MKWGVIVFPGSNCDRDCAHVLADTLGQDVSLIWHGDTSLGEMDAVILPGGFSYGDYLRTGAIAQLSPIMHAVKEFARAGGLVLGICNGFPDPARGGVIARSHAAQHRPFLYLRRRLGESGNAETRLPGTMHPGT